MRGKQAVTVSLATVLWVLALTLMGGHPMQDLFTDLDGPNRQSPIASVQRTGSPFTGHSAVPRGTNVARINSNRATRIAAQGTQSL